MKRKLWVVLLLAAVLVLGVTLSAGAQGKGGGGKLGLVFNLWDMILGTTNVSSNDGLSAGVGMKYWLADKMAIRGLLDFAYLHDKVADTTNTVFGLSGTFEYHFKTGRVSPYAGGQVGINIQSATDNLGLLLGGLFGVEMRVMDSLGLFAEYGLSIFTDDNDTNIFLGAGNNASIGVVVYL
jgi:hypothetical protein